jgi:5-methylcytosine-specific restriction protein A
MPDDFPMPDKPREFAPIRASRPVGPKAEVYDRERGTAYRRGYDRTWQRLRKWVLAGEPLCRHCKAADRLVVAEELHHVQSIKSCPERRLDPSNLIPLCHACHMREEARLSREEK